MKRRDFLKLSVSLAAFGPGVLRSLVPAPDVATCWLAVEAAGRRIPLEMLAIGWAPTANRRLSRRLCAQGDLRGPGAGKIEAVVLMSPSGIVLRRYVGELGTHAGGCWTFNYALDIDMSDVHPSHRDDVLKRFLS